MKFDVPFAFIAGLAAVHAAALHHPEQGSETQIKHLEDEIQHFEDVLAQDYRKLWALLDRLPGWKWPVPSASSVPSSASISTTAKPSSAASSPNPVATSNSASASSVNTSLTSSVSSHQFTSSIGLSAVTDSLSASISASPSSSPVPTSSPDLSSIQSASLNSTTYTSSAPFNSSGVGAVSSSSSASQQTSSSAVLTTSASLAPFQNTSSSPQPSLNSTTGPATLYTTYTTLCTQTTNGTTGVATHTHSAPITSSFANATSSAYSINSTKPVSGPFTNSTFLSSVNPTSSSVSRGFKVSANATGSTLSTQAAIAGSSSTSSTMAPTANADITSATYCQNLCSNLKFTSGYNISPVSCQAYAAGSTINITGGQQQVACGSTVTPNVGLCRVVLTIATSEASQAYMEVWLPNDNTTSWNGRTMSTDNGGLNGCVHFSDMNYVTGKGFAAIGDNGGHNSSAFDGTWAFNNNENVVDWAYRARHESVAAGKEVVSQFYAQKPSHSYYVGCSTGGQQGLHSAQYFPNDFDGIIAGSSAADFNHLQDWSGRFIQLTGKSGSDTFLTQDQWVLVQSKIQEQCDEPLDGVADGILEDPTICKFDASVLQCSGNNTNNCLTATQVSTVEKVFTELYNTNGQLLYPALLYGSEVDAYRLGQLSGTVQGITNDWFRFGVYNNSDFDVTQLNQNDYAKADSLDQQHGYVSSFNGDLSAFRSAGKKMIMYHGMADPLVSGGNSQRYYLKVAKTLGLSNTDIDQFMRYFRISGMAHCGVGGISGAGPWMFGQNGAAAVPGVADNIIDRLVDWVENSKAPDVLTGTKFFYDQPSQGLQYIRSHCRFPYRTTYNGGDYTRASGWGCKLIDNWQQCAVGATPRLCNADGSFE